MLLPGLPDFPRTLVAAAIAVCVAPALAQNTSSALTGRVLAQDGKPVSGAQVQITHIDSGSQTSSRTDADGRYSARGLRAGGPYRVLVTEGGRSESRDSVFLPLAETLTLDLQFRSVTAVERTVVTGTAISDRFGPNSVGAGTRLSRRDLENQASISRSLQDVARIDPRLAQTDKERGEISAAGQNTRFNSITIDGVTINDTFGLESNNLPTLKQPISIDALEAVQVNLSNYDVTQRGYTGANINAVTKSGTNELRGSVLYSFRNDDLAGQRFNRTGNTYSQPPKFDETLIGATVGGPIIKDRLFFFAAYEDLKSTRNAVSFGPVGSSQTNVAITPAAISGAQDIARTTYGINIGDIAADDATLKVKDVLVKFDWNIAEGHKANLRYTKTDQDEPIYPNFNATNLSLSSNWYVQKKTIDTLVGQWFGDWSEALSTEFKLSQRKYDSVPINNARLPAMQLSFGGALPTGFTGQTGTRSLNFGTERSRHFNVLRTDTLDAYAGAVWRRGEHEIKFGSDFQDNDIYNAFLQDTFGNYSFSCQNSSATYTYSFGTINCATATAAQVEQAVLENFQRGRPTSFQVQVPAAGRTLEDAVARWKLRNTGFFAQDTWTVSDDLTVNFGVRVDRTGVPTKPIANPAAQAAVVPGNPITGTRASGGFGLDNTRTLDGTDLVQPRVGFNWNLDAKRPTQLRGGFGLFQGAAANVWLSNPFSNTGVATRIVGCGGNFAACDPNGGTFNANPDQQPGTLPGSPPAANVDFLSPNLKQPSVWKANLGFEHQLPIGLVASVEYLYTRTKDGIYYQHLNLGAPTRIGPDGRELFYTAQGYNPACWTPTGGSVSTGACAGFRSRALSNPAFNNVLLAENTDKGFGSSLTFALQQPVQRGFGWSLAYTRSKATEVSPLTSSVSNSNFNARSVFNPNENVAANSAYLTKNRLNGSMNFERRWFGQMKTTIGVFYEGRSGKPYSWTFANDMNGDGVSGNDLMYIPRGVGSGEVVFLGDTATSRVNEERFWSIVNSEPALRDVRGGPVGRNTGTSPYVHTFDVRITQEVPGFASKHRGKLILDLVNIGNMINRKWGRIDEIAFQGGGAQVRNFVRYAGIDAQGRYVYSVANTPSDYVTRQNRGESQWAVQVGLQYSF
ncbi:TonB-dependent receptor [Piscinibacterium candidicorallinum]|uniref:TonB-dependent receptor domain-containing protein n=1 Tax=Piscinibacterium candidicorallinum TaxID=1793872 RepID=A0ABV7H9D4_9BURK